MALALLILQARRGAGRLFRKTDRMPKSQETTSARLAAELREARGEDAKSLQLEIAHLKEQLANRTKALFGDSSERRPCAEHKTDERSSRRASMGAYPPAQRREPQGASALCR